MARSLQVDLTRRFLLMASSGLFVPRWARAEGYDAPVLYWTLDDNGDAARERVHETEDAISSRTGRALWVGEGRSRALRLDGYSVWFEHIARGIHLAGGTITLAAWVALESYPVNEAAIVELETEPDSMYSLSIDKWGFLRFTVRCAGISTNCTSDRPLPRSGWTHIAATLGKTGANLYTDGVLSVRLPPLQYSISLENNVHVTIGRSRDCPIVAGVYPTGVLNGLIRDLRIFESELAPGAIHAMMDQSKPDLAADLQINRKWCGDDPQRPAYHALPPRAWTNEPHGLVHWGGQYHLFYQKNANGPYWGHINWGHMTSPDMYRWTEMPVALSPEPGPDAEGCWSGSVIDHDGKLAIIYTAGNGSRSSICLAHSDDGIRFTKYPGNPIIPQPPTDLGCPEFRDPFVWREEETYYLIIGSAIKHVGGTALLYRSKDLINWEFRKPLLVGDRETSGVFWEMPIFVKLGDQHALIVCEVPGRASYWVGRWRDETFVPYSRNPQRLDLFNHMLSPTPHRTNDGRTIVMGIIPDERSPKECWRAGWAHLYSLPRILTADARGRIHQRPLEDISKRSEPVVSRSDITINAERMTPIEGAHGEHLHIRAVFRRGKSHSVTLRLRSSPDGQEQTDIRYEWQLGKLILDRTRSSLDSNVKRDIQEATYFPDEKDRLALNVFLDRSVLEVFMDDRAAFSARIYPTLDVSNQLAVGCSGTSGTLETIDVRRMKPTR